MSQAGRVASIAGIVAGITFLTGGASCALFIGSMGGGTGSSGWSSEFFVYTFFISAIVFVGALLVAGIAALVARARR